MDALRNMEEAEADGVKFWIEDGKLKKRFPDSAWEWKQTLIPYEGEILSLLNGEPVGEPPEETFSAKLSPTSAADLITDHPEKRPAIIDGICRRGETVNIIGASKAGKSWFILNTLLSIAAGREWFGMGVTQGRVLLVDNELHREELAGRINYVAKCMDIDQSVLTDWIDVLSLRGRLQNIGQIAGELQQYADRNYSMIAIDAFYRTLPEGVSENDNAQMASVYNTIDYFADQMNCSVVLNHHSSKGDQSGKAKTDVGSGAGSISRAADTHLIIRSHEIEDCAVLDGVLRSWAPIEPITIRWDYPLWTATHIEPELRRPASARDVKQAKLDGEADEKILGLLASGPKDKGKLRSGTGWGVDRLTRCLARLEDKELVKHSRKRKRSTGKAIDVYTAIPASELPEPTNFV